MIKFYYYSQISGIKKSMNKRRDVRISGKLCIKGACYLLQGESVIVFLPLYEQHDHLNGYIR